MILRRVCVQGVCVWGGVVADENKMVNALLVAMTLKKYNTVRSDVGTEAVAQLQQVEPNIVQ